MKLSQLYSNIESFKTVRFKDGLNLVVGEIKDPTNLDKDSHNLGKTTLVNLIDFLMLKEISDNHFLKNEKFRDYVFFLELRLNNGKFLTIKRPAKNNTKISIKIHDKKYQNYVSCYEWDYENLALSSSSAEKNPKKIINDLLGFDILLDYNYRKTINYFLRTQNDYSDVFKLSKFKGGDKDWKPILFEMLGFDGTLLENKYELEDAKTKQISKISNIVQGHSIDTKAQDRIKGEIQIKEDEKKQLEKRVDKFDFYIKERSLNKHIVEDLESRISSLNSEEYDLTFEIDKINESLENGVKFDLEKTIEIFKEAKIFFTEQLKHNYEELIEFNTKITEERNKYLLESLQEKKDRLSSVQDELQSLNSERISVLGILAEKDTFSKFKQYQKSLIEIERDIQNLINQMDDIDIIKKENRKLDKIESQIKELIEKIDNTIAESNVRYTNIRKDYYNFIRNITFATSQISIEQNSVGNVDFKVRFEDENSVATSQGEGFTYKKIMCTCFDLALLKNYSDRSFFNFVYHDGSLENLDPRKKIRYLELIENICTIHDIQYILTLLDSDVPNVEGKKYEFKKANIAVELSDDENGTLFGFEF